MDVARLARRLASGGGWKEIRQVFGSWSVEVPASFEETFIEKDSYWHAWDETRSVSLTSLIIEDKHGRPVGADAINRSMVMLLEGNAVDGAPSGLIGRAVTASAIQPARASQMLQGMIAERGRVLLVTVTSDDLLWARELWMSIRHHRTRESD